MYMINPRIKGQGMPDELTDAEYEQLPSDKKIFYSRQWYDDDGEVDVSVESVDISGIDLSNLLEGTDVCLS